MDVGKVTSIENNHREVPSAKKGTKRNFTFIYMYICVVCTTVSTFLCSFIYTYLYVSMHRICAHMWIKGHESIHHFTFIYKYISINIYMSCMYICIYINMYIYIGTSVSIKIACENSTMTYGRQFDHTNALYSKLTRQSIDALKVFFKDDMTKDDWGLVVKLKKVFSIA
jgi:hypothetical protein